MEAHGIWFDYFAHFGLETIGGLIAIYAYKYCKHDWHRWSIWFFLTALTTVVTVQIVG